VVHIDTIHLMLVFRHLHTHRKVVRGRWLVAGRSYLSFLTPQAAGKISRRVSEEPDARGVIIDDSSLLRCGGGDSGAIGGVGGYLQTDTKVIPHASYMLAILLGLLGRLVG